MTIIGKYNFHDQGVTGISLKNGSIYFDAECFNDTSNVYMPTPVVFSGVSNVKINGITDKNIAAVYDDGEIIHFEIKDDNASITIEWNDYKNKKSTTKTYTFNFKGMSIKGEKVI